MLVEEIKNIKQGKNDLRKFGITVGIVFGLLGVLFWRLDKYSYIYLLILSAAFISLGIAMPILLKPVHKVWMAVAILMGWFVTRVILAILFYVVVTPIGLVMRCFGKKFLDLTFDRNSDSYWIPKKKMKLKKENYEKQY